ncbi:class I SAM-dependent methyltransferase [Hydrogenobacter thermophilus]|uniref:class I SAM-dependent methyltransferase n=1 Tax=Hydrogenobacter thermophilus TaxID=940 RepID=UPI0030FCB215
MAVEDKERWDQRYLRGWETQLHKTLLEFYHLAKVGKALELACGTGENAIFLAKEGFDVDAIDISCVAIEKARRRAKDEGVNVNFMCADLDDYALPQNTYNLIINFYYLNRKLSGQIVRALKPGGILIFETYNERHKVLRKDFNPLYLLKEGELLILFKELEVIYYAENFNISTFIGIFLNSNTGSV